MANNPFGAMPLAGPNIEMYEPDKKDRQDTARALAKLTRRVSRHQSDHDEIHELMSYQGPRATAKTGEIVKEIYTSGAINPQDDSDLAHMPDEILMRITSYLPLGPTVALSLTCKTLAAHAANARNHAQVIFTNKEAAAKIAKGRPAISATAKKLAKGKPVKPRVVPFTKPHKLAMLILLTPWFPNTTKLCYRCLKFRPRGRAGWTTNSEITESGMATQKAIDLGPKCPACAEWTALQRAKDTDAYRKAEANAKKCVKGI